MSARQEQAIWELCRLGFPAEAEIAAACWGEGKCFETAEQFQIRRSLESLIDQCNWEVEQDAETD